MLLPTPPPPAVSPTGRMPQIRGRGIAVPAGRSRHAHPRHCRPCPVNCAEIVTDPDRGGNALFFPVRAQERDGYEALEDDGTIVCLTFVAYDF